MSHLSESSSSSSSSSPESPLNGQALIVTDLGRMRYDEALAVQRRVNQEVIDGDSPPTLLLVEHEPVITVSYRKGAARHLIASQQRLDQLGITVEQTDRGGDVTYHGPGQLVAYPIVRLGPLGLNLSRYMRLLEQIVIDTLAHFDVRGFRDEAATGVWVETTSGTTAKVCALGVRIRKNTTMHGLALNVNPDLAHFDTIVPCGLHDRTVTSLHALRGDRAPNISDVKHTLTETFKQTLAARPVHWP